MEIVRKVIKIRDIYNGYLEDEESQTVFGYDGRLDMRPDYQRGFIYGEGDAKKQTAVIHTILQGYPVGLFYWERNEDGTFSILDGQQRTISICEFREIYSLWGGICTSTANDQIGLWYNKYQDIEYDADIFEARIKELILDDEVQKDKGIYAYLLTDDEKSLGLRTHAPAQRRKLYELQNGKCKVCGEPFSLEELIAHHIIRWIDGGKTTIENGALVCKPHHSSLH